MVDARRLSFVEPAGLAALATLLRLLLSSKAPGVPVSWQAPEDHSVCSYLARMDLLREFGIDVEHGRRPVAGRFFELHVIDVGIPDVSNRLTIQLCEVANTNWNAAQDAIGLMSYGLGECIDNVVAHSQSPFGGFTCAQAYRARSAMQFAVCDGGIGIRSSLSLARSVTSDAEAIRLALRKGVTSKESGHAGEGLFVISRMVEANGGVLVVHSGEARYVLDASNGTEETDETPAFPGTLVACELALTPRRRLEDIFDELFPEDVGGDWADWPV